MSLDPAAPRPVPHRPGDVVANLPAPATIGHVAARKRSRRAAQKISALGEMTGGIAHDFRNLLAVIASGLNIAEVNRGDPAKFGDALAALRDGIERGMAMTSRLLTFAGAQDVAAGPEDINVLLAKLRLFLGYGAGPGIRIVLDLSPHLPDCLVDPTQFNAAIINLVVNARDAMPNGGAIRISTAPVTEDAHVKYVCVGVHDDGVGMAPEIVGRIFDPYFTTKGDSGTGLGIPQVNALVRQAGGYMTVDSTPGGGCTFDLYFPVHERQPVVAAADAWRQIDRWADEGGAVTIPVPHAARQSKAFHQRRGTC